MRKNVAGQRVSAQLVDSSGAAVTSGTTTVQIVGDGTVTPSGAGTTVHRGNGLWEYAPTQAETNADHIAFTLINAGAVPASVQVYTTSLDPHDTVAGGMSGVTDIQGRLPASLQSGRMQSNVDAIADDAGAPANLASGVNELVPFTVQAGPTSTSIPTGLTAANANKFAGRVVNVNGETRGIIASSTTPVILTTNAFQQVPAQNDAAVIS